MVYKSKDSNIKISLRENEGNAKLRSLILKKGKRNVSAFKKAFGTEPDFPSVEMIREKAWS